MPFASSSAGFNVFWMVHLDKVRLKKNSAKMNKLSVSKYRTLSGISPLAETNQQTDYSWLCASDE